MVTLVPLPGKIPQYDWTLIIAVIRELLAKDWCFVSLPGGISVFVCLSVVFRTHKRAVRSEECFIDGDKWLV